MNRMFTAFAILCAMLIGAPLMAQDISADGTFSLQGRLTTGSGTTAVADGQHSLVVKIYEAGTNNVIATETETVTTVNGVFSTMIGDNSTLDLDADMEYEIGVSVNSGAELMPRLPIGDAPSAIVADVAANAEAVNGFSVSTGGTNANALVTTDASGRIDADVLRNSINITGAGVDVNTNSGRLNITLGGGASGVSSINGLTGDVQLDVSGNGVSLDTTGGVLMLNVTGSGGGSFSLPFSGNTNVNAGQTAFRLTTTGAGSALDLTSAGSASATLNLRNSAAGAGAILISARNATGGTAFQVMGSGQTTVNATGGTALSLTADALSDAVLELKNTQAGANADLINALDASGSAVFNVATSGATTIDANASDALTITNEAANGTVLSLQSNASAQANALIEARNSQSETVFNVAASGKTTIDAEVADALQVTTNAATGAALRLQNTATGATAQLMEAVDASGTVVFDVMANGQTSIVSSVDNALNVTTSATGGAALNLDGGLRAPDIVGSGTINAGATSTTINNALINTNSMVFVTVNSATSITGLSGLRVSAVNNGSFTVSLIDTALSLAGNVTFNYLIINR